ncbi:sensor domain-containing protein [Mycobacteroides abscessus]|uniref:sensor domain-containing protein n=1 Tax=Mycobacteroides abscessus TaxID=36809 RepID=UPI00140352AC|nr:sensor domain-containing protein [Mycobacteroides abscessus]
MTRRVLLLAISSIVVVAGCSAAVDGDPAAGRVAGSGLPPIAQVLPGDSAMSGVLGSPMRTEFPRLPGGLDALPGGVGDASPVECVGVRAAALRQSYEDAPVRAASESTWKTATDSTLFPTPDFRITLGVIELDTPESARRQYSSLVSRWSWCQGRTVVEHNVGGSGGTFTSEVTRVADAEGMLTAVVLESAWGDRPLPNQRALTAASRYLIDVSVTDTSWHTGGSVEPINAVAVARLVADKINSTA